MLGSIFHFYSNFSRTFYGDHGLHSLHLSHKKDAKLIWVKYILLQLSDRRTRRCKTHTEPGYKITCPLGNVSVLWFSRNTSAIIRVWGCSSAGVIVGDKQKTQHMNYLY